MNKTFSGIFIVVITLLFFNTNRVVAQGKDKIYPFVSIDYISEAKNWMLINPDTKIQPLEKAIDEAINKKDTLALIETLTQRSLIYAHSAQYSKSYDGYWKALALAEKIQDKPNISSIYHGLGWLYSLYNRKEKALKYFNKSNDILRDLGAKKSNYKQLIVRNYYSLEIMYRRAKNIEKARLYLDSCRMINKAISPTPHPNYLEAELGRILYLEQKYNASLSIFKKLTYRFKEDSPFLVMLYQFIGDTYIEQKKPKYSEYYYKEALRVAYTTESHLDLVPDIYEKLALLYERTNQYTVAFKHMRISKMLYVDQFSSKSESNNGLLEIKDTYRQAIENQQQLINQQRITQLEQNGKISQLKSYLLGSALFLVLVLGLVAYRYLRIMHKTEKKILAQQRENELTNTKELIKVKNKELTVSALQAIEKDKLLSEIKEKLVSIKGKLQDDEVNQLIKSINLDNKNNWEEFELRFLSVNTDFYAKLRELFPNLTSNDHKMCALIRLHFSSKNMANLLGISVESVNTNRHKIRKKLNLDRSINLEEYISQI